ncbi:NAD(P)H-binding protein [Mycobacterium sp.]|uniref:NAD(P)H-binding protein n=1 Tax=Mycobacterium sp. TaxID=1785 RepID=UPI002F3F42C7
MTAIPMYLVTGAGGGVGGVGRIVVDELLACGQTVRAMVHREDDRAEALRESGAEVVIGDLTDPVDVATALDGINRVFFSMSVSASYLEATTVVCSLAAETSDLDLLVNMSQMTVSQMTPTSTSESHQQRLHWLAERVIDWSPIPAVQIRPTVFLENPLFTLLAARSIREQQVLALPFGAGRTSPIAPGDVADAVVAVLRNPAEHIGAVYELTGPTVLDVDGLAAQYGRALGREITGQRVDFDDWRSQLAESGLDPHVQEHITTMARLHREDRYNRSTDQVQALTGHVPQSVEDFVRARRDLFV